MTNFRGIFVGCIMSYLISSMGVFYYIFKLFEDCNHLNGIIK